MAHTLVLTDGTVSVDLAATADPGIYLQEFRPTRPVRRIERVSGFPFVSGSRTIASALDDGAVEIVCLVAGTSVDNLQSQLVTLHRLLEQARRWEESRTGSPVRLVWKIQGTTNTAYRVVTGVPAMPEPLDPGEGNWLDVAAGTFTTVIAFTLTLEPTWHAGALTAVKAATTMTTTPLLNSFTTSTTTGDLDGPLSLEVNASGASFTHVWVAQCAQAPTVSDKSGAADAAAYNGAAQALSITGTATNAGGPGGISLDAAMAYPIRQFARIKVTSGTASKLQLRWYYYLGTIGNFAPVYGPWTTFSGTSGSYFLHDPGPVPALSAVRKRGYVSSLAFSVGVQLRTSDASTVGINLDYIEGFPAVSIVRLDGFDLSLGQYVAYEAIHEDGTFYWPRRVPVAYQMDASRTHDIDALRYGQLAPLKPNTTTIFWMQGQTDTTHTLALSPTMKVDHLPCYALGLRGAG